MSGPHKFASVQRRLGEALAANRQGSGIDHVMVVLPSYSVSESILSHYGDRIPALEHRYLNALLVAGRIESCRIVFISSRAPDPAVIDYYLELMPDERRAPARERITLLPVDDGTPRSVAARVLANPKLIQNIRDMAGGRPAFIEPWNVTANEVALAEALEMPINGTDPELRPLGFKSAGRRLMREAGVPLPSGSEDVRNVDDIVAAVRQIRAEHPAAHAVVVKLDDSGAGDGNAVIELPGGTEDDAFDVAVRQSLEAFPEWYRRDLRDGGVVELRIEGHELSSPSAQVDLSPNGDVVVLATHEQVLGGDSGQVYLGCQFPAAPAYAPQLAEYAQRIGTALARRGAVGRFSVDFTTVRPGPDAPWDVRALEVNLRKGGTTHPYAALRNIAPGRYDAPGGRWELATGGTRVYAATDNLHDPGWVGLDPATVIGSVAAAGLQFDHRSGSGVVLHMLSGLGIDGRMGLTAIAETHADAASMQTATRDVIGALAASRA
ncbi:MAG: peptide ligase PGM1-related protein [Candidatus Limnocylindria bacterium]